MSIKRDIKKIRDIDWIDFFAVVPMILAILISPIVGKKYNGIWAVSERKDEARDNGFHFFCFMRANHPEIKCVYVINKKASDYKKIVRFGNVVSWGSISHWLLYFNAKWLISSQRFSPSSYLTIALERLGLVNPSHIFLQHGITINKPEYLLADQRKVEAFVTATPQETTFVSEALGHPAEVVWHTGFARFDALHTFHTKAGQIMVMPTWRKWLRLKSEKIADTSFSKDMDDYIRAWISVFELDSFQELIRKYELKITFIMHPNMKKIISPDVFRTMNIDTVDLGCCDLQKIMQESEAIITDYSSVFFDMVYMKKSVIFYQFDEAKFRRYHYEAGWFDYHNSSFGKWCGKPDDVAKALEAAVISGFVPSTEYLDEHKKTFYYYDTDNCQRIFERLKKMQDREVS